MRCQFECELRTVFAQTRNPLGPERKAQRRQNAETKVAAKPLAYVLQRKAETAEPIISFSGFDEEFLHELRVQDSLVFAQERRAPQLRFGVLQNLANRRLGGFKTSRCTADRAGATNVLENLNLARTHSEESTGIALELKRSTPT